MRIYDDGHVPASSASVPRSKDILSTPDARFDVVHINPVGLLPPSQGLTYHLTCVDCFIRWPEAISVTAITAEAVAQAFVIGLPALVWQTILWQALMNLLGCK